MSGPDTRTRQHRATDPRASAWVSANAGSGKTYVLTRRVIRLLLSGCEPSRILCLTFTKAAAAEMSNRVFKLLGEWAVMPGPELARALGDVEGAVPDAARIAAARRLFARALETPGGLKIKTIHGFCEALLQRFPVEADLPGRFEVMDERRGLALLAEARATAIREAVADGEGPLGAALGLVLARTTDGGLDAVIDGFLRRREDYLAWIAGHGSLEAALASLPAALGVPAGMDRAALVQACGRSPDFGDDIVRALLPVLDGATKTMQDLAACLRQALGELDPAERARLWRSAFLTGEGKPRASAVTKVVEQSIPGTLERCAREASRLVELDGAIAACDVAEMTAAAIRLADRVMGHHAALKRAAGALDFDDLIQRTVSLLARSDAAAWVQYKLDEGLDHVLVDEAQDTSPDQWKIVRAITGEFFAGAGAREGVARTVFAVGDEKQSIYSFQGAEPHLFADNGVAFGRLAGEGGAAFHPISLNISFRSTRDVVKAVDAVFADPAAHAGLTRDPAPTVHETNRADDPGLVEVWPEVEPAETPKPERWEDPVDVTGPGSPEVRLATRIADEVAGWLARGERIAATGRRIRPGDVMILVRKRGAFVEAVNRALKARGIEIAGADRLDVIGHIVAEDLMAAARVALLPEDDLSLAAFARSPLVPPAERGGSSGLTDAELFALAHGRRASLWQAVREAAEAGSGPAMRLADRVQALMARADAGDAYGFFAALVGRNGGRAAFRARIGREADEVIDEFLALALAAEEQGAASLAGFLALTAEAREDVKREVDTTRDEVRVMTVHGSKGLEAPVVFLVDPGSAPSSGQFDPTVLPLENQRGAPLVWLRPGPKPPLVEAAVAAHRLKQEEEYRRLLYVGLTRAADRLIVCGMRGMRSKPDGRWHTLVASALGREAEAVTAADGSIDRWVWCAPPPRAAKPPVDDASVRPAPPPLPEWLSRPLRDPVQPRALTPSSAAALLAEDEEDRPAAGFSGEDPMDRARGLDSPAARRGRLIHRLFEILPEAPPAGRRRRALDHLARMAPDLGEAEHAAIAGSVLALMDDPRWAEVFGPGGRAEVSLAGAVPLPDGREVPVFGQIDRLVVGADEVLIVDFKTGRKVPDAIPLPYATQLALYRALMLRIRPGATVRAAILWTEAPRLDELPAAEMDAILARIVTNMGTTSAPAPA